MAKDKKKKVADDAGEQQPRRRGKGRPFVKGVSGNPAGRKPGTHQRTIMLEALKLVPDMAYLEAEAGQTLADIFALMVGNGSPK